MGWDDLSRSINDSAVAVVASKDAWFATAIDCWKGRAVVISLTGRGVQKDGANLGIWLQLGERTIRENQIGFSRGHLT